MRAAGRRGRHRGRRHLTTMPDPRASMRPDSLSGTSGPTPRSWTLAGATTSWISRPRRAVSTAHGHRHRLPSGGGWATAGHLRTELVADALTAACRQHCPIRPVIFHSDRGCQYTSQQCAALAGQGGIQLSVGRTGQR
ncbi:DDE-type integrase/transposase/recombinase [Streptomyces sp. NPDC086835]|uniref:DDE-type integrase/transposase/recombinase n=1 Tax=Streptomyces sp. NPDC086835 TaxID=3365761 RepID=UPI00380D2C49